MVSVCLPNLSSSIFKSILKKPKPSTQILPSSSRENSEQSGFYSAHAEIIFVVSQMQSKYLSSSFYLTSPCHTQFGLTFYHALPATPTDFKLKSQRTTRLSLTHFTISEFGLLQMLFLGSRMSFSKLFCTVYISDETSSLLWNSPPLPQTSLLPMHLYTVP